MKTNQATAVMDAANNMKHVFTALEAVEDLVSDSDGIQIELLTRDGLASLLQVIRQSGEAKLKELQSQISN